ncbi:MAG TPA: hypothetical protein VLG11_02540 [Candidatus Saccharimonadales bacterium]|nr:hypothetical protein [Candidatus Saccharimonadales bacterium]
MSDTEFKPSEDDILVMLRHLRHVAPEHATPEKAIFLLEQQRIHYKTLEELYPELIEEILGDFEKY